jgi:3(or 17)beta-hydroxysteroid dehydrogenase
MNRTDGKVAIVTGATTGIGEATARRLAESGAIVIVTGRRLEQGEKLATRIRNESGRAEFLELDTTSEERWKQVVDEVTTRHGRLDILINCAGRSINETIDRMEYNEFRDIMRDNLDSVFLGTRTVATRMSAGGSIVNVASLAAHVCMPGQSAYASAKGAIKQFSRACAVDFAVAGTRIRVNSVSPAAIETPMLSRAIAHRVAANQGATVDEATAKIVAMHPIGRIGKPEEVANAICFLASDDAGFITGTDLLVDGGFTSV